ncbi:MAG: hypothetical protein CMP20_03980 [Rickettsiales bacterium]|nr:hypothetical protein [Rickettsiales bacterium]
MAQAKHTFVESKMNKDLDDRLLSGGQYRNAVNIAVSKSEDSDVGALENVLGNRKISDLFPSNVVPPANITIIGWQINEVTNDIFLFITNYCDTSANLDRFASSGSKHYIIKFNTATQDSNILAEGKFLNFSTTHPILGSNIIEELLFWTDNRNQPRKINWSTATAFSGNTVKYYTTEDQISVAKYYPYNPLTILDQTSVDQVFWDDATYDGVQVSKFTRPNNDPFSSSIYLYDQFTIASNADLLDVAVIQNNETEIIVYPRLGSTNPPATGIAEAATFYHNTAINTTDKLLPPSARVNIVYSSTAVQTISAGAWITAGLINVTAIDYLSPRFPLQFLNAAVQAPDQPVFSGPGKAVSSIIDPNESNSVAFRVDGQGNLDAIAFNQDVKLGFGSIDVDLCIDNPYYDVEWPGDSLNLKDKFVRFAYRFKFDDDEYSLTAPFTQPVFIPRQDGFFLDVTPAYTGDRRSGTIDDFEEAGQATIVDWMENNVKEVKLNLNFEYPVNEINERLKVKELEILYKESDALSIKVVESINFRDTNLEITNNSTNSFTYTYQSNKPFKTLPDREVTRTYDKVPLKAQSQESAGNRVIYGNYIDKHTSPLTLDYKVSVGEKLRPTNSNSNLSYLSYPNHTLKQNRTYQVGVVLCDRYGRQSDVILSPPLEEAVELPPGSGIYYGDSTITNPYKDGEFWKETLEWPGDSLKVLFENLIPTEIAEREGYPGLYSETNPTGWYTYKIVVKQQEQDYYNVYLPGLLYGNPIGASTTAQWGNGACNDPSQTNEIQPGQNTMRGLSSTDGIQVGDRFCIEYPGSPPDQYCFTVEQVLSDSVIRFSPTWNGGSGGAALTLAGWCDEDLYGQTCCTQQWPGYQLNKDIVFFAGQSLITNESSFVNPTEMVTTLLTDNINKIPADLEDVRPNQLQYKTTDDLIYPRVARSLAKSFLILDGNNEPIPGTTLYWSSQVDTGENADNVKLLGQFNDLFPADFESVNLYKVYQNPASGVFTNQFQLGTPSLGLQTPAVFETQPVRSNLDIYWETSTSGLITDLNDLIADGNTIVGIGGSSSFLQSESLNNTAQNPNQVGEVYGVNPSGLVTPVSSLVINQVRDTQLSGVDYSSSYTLGAPTNGVYPILALDNPVYLENQSANQRQFLFSIVDANGATHNYSFIVNISNHEPDLKGRWSAAHNSYGVDGFTTRTINIGPTNGLAQLAIPGAGEVVYGEFSPQPFQNGSSGDDERIYFYNGSANVINFPIGLSPDQFSETEIELQVSRTTTATGYPPEFTGPFVSLPANGQVSNPDSKDGFYLSPAGFSNSTIAANGKIVTPQDYNLPDGSPAWKITWNGNDSPNFSGQATPWLEWPTTDQDPTTYRFLRVIMRDANGNAGAGALNLVVADSTAGINEIPIAFNFVTAQGNGILSSYRPCLNFVGSNTQCIFPPGGTCGGNQISATCISGVNSGLQDTTNPPAIPTLILTST